MRKIVLPFIATLLTSCGWLFSQLGEDPTTNYHSYWYVKNGSQEPITITRSDLGQTDIAIKPGDSVLIHKYYMEYPPTFDLCYGLWESEAEEKRHLDVLSSEKEVLKRWEYTDKDTQERQFFRQSSWRFYHNDKIACVEFIWVFDILPEDIRSETE